MTHFVECPTCRTLLLPEQVAAHELWHHQMRFVATGLIPPTKEEKH